MDPLEMFTQRNARPVFPLQVPHLFPGVSSPQDRDPMTDQQLITSPISEASIIYPTNKARHSHGELRGASARVRAPVCRDDAPASRGGVSFTALHQSRGPGEQDNNVWNVV